MWGMYMLCEPSLYDFVSRNVNFKGAWVWTGVNCEHKHGAKHMGSIASSLMTYNKPLCGCEAWFCSILLTTSWPSTALTRYIIRKQRILTNTLPQPSMQWPPSWSLVFMVLARCSKGTSAHAEHFASTGWLRWIMPHHSYLIISSPVVNIWEMCVNRMACE